MKAQPFQSESRVHRGHTIRRAHEHIKRLTRASIERAVDDCRVFERQARGLLREAYHGFKVEYDCSSAGHDFWLTRNGHGCGFWDRGLGEVGEKLSTLAKSFGECNLSAYRGHLYLE